MQLLFPEVEKSSFAKIENRELALFLGAGFAKWSAGLPLASELFDFSFDAFGPREARFLERVKDIKATWDHTHNSSQVEEFISHAMTLSVRDTQSVVWYIGRRLSDPYIWTEFRNFRIRRQILMIDEYRARQRPGIELARRFLLRKLDSTRVILTTNYDLIPEYSLGSCNFHYGVRGEVLIGRGPYPVSVWRKPVTLNGQVPLLKLHGSISWDLNGRYTDGRRALTGNALIVPPSPEKSPPSLLRDVWKVGAEELKNSQKLIVFGFAFNPYDDALLTYLAANGNQLRKIALVDICPSVSRASSLWPNAQIETFSPDDEGFQALKNWIDKKL